MMKKIFLIIAVGTLLSNPIYSQTKDFGLGIILGEPTGLSGKLWTTNTNAFDFAAAWSFKGDGHMLLQADYVWHNTLTRASSGQLALYYGIGGRVIFSDDPNAGVRIPIGLDYQFTTAPIDIFIELAPILDVIPETDFDLGGGLGVRFWFN
jgi:hypothetical protein